VSEIYLNAVDSLRIGIDFFLKERSYSSRKHTILTLFHSIELFLKERLHQENRLLIYRDIDAKITEDSSTVGIREILARLDNIGLGLPKDERGIIEKIQKRRNRIEHHRYDHKEADDIVIADSFKFILFFAEGVLKKDLASDIDLESLRAIRRAVFERNELDAIAHWRFDEWAKKQWPEWNPENEDIPEEFSGTLDCPICTESYLVIGYHDKPFCFHCNTTIDAADCPECGRTFLVDEGCGCGYGEQPQGTDADDLSND